MKEERAELLRAKPHSVEQLDHLQRSKLASFPESVSLAADDQGKGESVGSTSGADETNEGVQVTEGESNEKGAADETMPADRNGSALAVHPRSEARAKELALRSEVSREIAKMAEPRILGSRALRSKRIIDPGTLDDAVANSMRMLRVRVRQHCESSNAVLLVTSMTGGGGGSFVAFNLAAALALQEHVTALVLDCHLQRPHRQGFVRSRSVRGLSDYLGGTVDGEEEIILPTGIPKVRIIPAGTRRRLSGEYFSSVKMLQLIDATAARYRERFVIMDAPPMTESAHTMALAELADHVLLVVPYGRTTTAKIKAVIESIDPKKLIGCVFNNVPTAR